MRRQRLAATIVAAPNPLDFRLLDQARLAAQPTGNAITIAAGLSATPAIRGWRSSRAGGVMHRLASALIIVGTILTLAWSATLGWVVFRIMF